jgi:AcrR family transcriptional regulator
MAATDDRKSPLPRGPHALAPEEVAANQRRRILQALPPAVEEHGYAATTVARIVALAGVSSRAFYGQFSGKRECFAVAYEDAQERLLAVLAAPCAGAPDLPERLALSAGSGLAFLAAEPALARLLVVEAPGVGGEIAARHYAWLERYAELLGQAAGRGAPARGSARSAALTIVGGIASRVAQSVLAEEAERLPQLGPELVAVVLAIYGERDPEARTGG